MILLSTSRNIICSRLPYVQEITDELSKLQENEQMKDKLAGMEMPDLSPMTKMQINMSGNSDYEMPADLIELLQNSDVTTITDNTITLTDECLMK